MDRTESITIIESPYHPDISKDLYKGVTAYLDKERVLHNRVTVLGTFEIPITLRMVIEAIKNFGMEARDSEDKPLKRADGFIILGCFISDPLSEALQIYNPMMRSLQEIACNYAIPISYGVVLETTLEKAREKASPEGKNKGAKVAESCLALIHTRIKLGLESGRIYRP